MWISISSPVHADSIHPTLPGRPLEDTCVSTVEPSILAAVWWITRAGTGDRLHTQSQEGGRV